MSISFKYLSIKFAKKGTGKKGDRVKKGTGTDSQNESEPVPFFACPLIIFDAKPYKTGKR